MNGTLKIITSKGRIGNQTTLLCQRQNNVARCDLVFTLQRDPANYLSI